MQEGIEINISHRYAFLGNMVPLNMCVTCRGVQIILLTERYMPSYPGRFKPIMETLKAR